MKFIKYYNLIIKGGFSKGKGKSKVVDWKGRNAQPRMEMNLLARAEEIPILVREDFVKLIFNPEAV